MSELWEITPDSEEVVVRGKAVQMRGLPVAEIGSLLRHLRGMASFDVDSLVSLGDPVVASLIVSASSLGDDKEARAKAEKAVINLTLGEKASLLAALIRRTAPTGIGPFVELMVALGGGEQVGAALASASSQGNSHKPLKPSSMPDTATKQ